MNPRIGALALAKILIADDTPANLVVLSRMLEGHGFAVRTFPNGRLALSEALSDPPDLFLLDIMMPEMDGYEVCRRLKETGALRDIPVIFISALTDAFDKVKAFGCGGVDYVSKPFQLEEVVARVETHVKLRRLQLELEVKKARLEELVLAQVKEISDSHMATIFALAKLSESRDDETGRHLERVRTFCRLLAVRLGEGSPYSASVDQAFIENIIRASPLHDIGKVAIPDSVLKKPGKLDPDEFEQMKLHSLLGAQTLETVRARYPRSSFLNMCIAIARSHHEKWDGTGYPDGLKGESIPLEARIMALADVYDALRSRRCYKAPFSHQNSLEIIGKNNGTHFDPVVVEAFWAVAPRFGEVHGSPDGLAGE